jgi:hypothetical protein
MMLDASQSNLQAPKQRTLTRFHERVRLAVGHVR